MGKILQTGSKRNKIMSKKNIGIIIGLVVLVVIAILLTRNNQPGQNNTSQQQTATTPTPEPSAPTTGGKLSYTDAVKKYGSNRIQFDATCQAHPNNVTFKAGTQVMFDNRAAVARVINFNGAKYTLAAYGYLIVSMTAAKYPASILVDCGSSQNVATVLIQK